jgi:hypothetical protein
MDSFEIDWIGGRRHKYAVSKYASHYFLNLSAEFSEQISMLLLIASHSPELLVSSKFTL